MTPTEIARTLRERAALVLPDRVAACRVVTVLELPPGDGEPTEWHAYEVDVDSAPGARAGETIQISAAASNGSPLSFDELAAVLDARLEDLVDALPDPDDGRDPDHTITQPITLPLGRERASSPSIHAQARALAGHDEDA